MQASDAYTPAWRGSNSAHVLHRGGSNCAHAYPAQIVCMHTPNYGTAVSQGLHCGALLLQVQSQLSLFLDLHSMVFNKVLAH